MGAPPIPRVRQPATGIWRLSSRLWVLATGNWPLTRFPPHSSLAAKPALPYTLRLGCRGKPADGDPQGFHQNRMEQEFTPLAARVAAFIRSPQDRSPSPTSHRDSTDSFEALARDVFAVQFRHNPAYQSWCRARGITPAEKPDWDQFPAVPTDAFKEIVFSSIPAGDRTTEFRSSGTTAQRPSRHFHFGPSLALYETAALTGFKEHLLGDLDDLVEAGMLGPLDQPAFIALTPPPEAAPHSSLVHMLAAVLRTHGASDSLFAGSLASDGTWELDLDRLLFALRRSLCANRPVVLMGTAFNVVHLLDAFEAGNRRYRLAAGSRLMETGGYKGRSRELPRAELHAEVGRRLGLAPGAIVTEYGMSELSSQAYDRVALPLVPGTACPPVFQFPHWTRATVVSPETGREVPDGGRGILRIVDLANLWSVAAIQTADEAIRRGDRFELVGRMVQSEPRGCSRMTA